METYLLGPRSSRKYRTLVVIRIPLVNIGLQIIVSCPCYCDFLIFFIHFSVAIFKEDNGNSQDTHIILYNGAMSLNM